MDDYSNRPAILTNYYETVSNVCDARSSIKNIFNDWKFVNVLTSFFIRLKLQFSCRWKLATDLAELIDRKMTLYVRADRSYGRGWPARRQQSAFSLLRCQRLIASKKKRWRRRLYIRKLLTRLIFRRRREACGKNWYNEWHVYDSPYHTTQNFA